MKFNQADFDEIFTLITDINVLDITDSIGIVIEYDRESDAPVLGLSIGGEVEETFESISEAKTFLEGFFAGLNNSRMYNTATLSVRQAL